MIILTEEFQPLESELLILWNQGTAFSVLTSAAHILKQETVFSMLLYSTNSPQSGPDKIKYLVCFSHVTQLAASSWGISSLLSLKISDMA